jgi:uncharacterized repeat protein (TIGR01451 family)
MKKKSVLTAFLIILICTSIFTSILPMALAGKPSANPRITIELQVNDGSGWVDADSATGPQLLIGSGVVDFRVIVTNTGDVALSKISITDTASNTVTAIKKMEAGASWQRDYHVNWASGQREYSASVEAVYKGKTYSDVDNAYYYGLVPNPSIQVVKTANLHLAAVGETVTYTFKVTNPGNVPLSTVSVVDNVAGTASYSSGDSNSNNLLDNGETWIFIAEHTVESSPDPLENTVTAAGYYGSTQYSDTDTYSLDVSEQSPTPTMLTSPNIQSYGQFGEGVAIGDGYIAVGAWYEDLDTEWGPWSAGRVYVYDASNLEADPVTLISPNAITDGWFGYVVAIDEGYLMVGAPYEDGAGSEGSEQGAVYVYSLADLGVAPLQLTSPVAYATEGGEFGVSLATDGTYLFVGAESENVNSMPESGAVHVFALSDGTYVDTYTQPTAENNAYYGCKVAIHDTRLYVGAFGAEMQFGNSRPNVGAVYVYDLGTKDLLTTIQSPMYGSDGRFGISLAVTDDYIIVGADREWVWGTSISSPGLVHIFAANTFEEVAMIQSPNPTQWGHFGQDVVTDGTYLVVSATSEGTISESGKAYVYTLSDVSATPIVLTSPNPVVDGEFAAWSSVAISDGIIVIGAPYEDALDYSRAGNAYIYDFSS